MEQPFDPRAIADPTMRLLVGVSTAEFDGASLDGSARAVVLGDLTLSRIALEPTTSAAGIVGQRLTEAINAALESARQGARAAILAIPGLDPLLRDVVAGEAALPVEGVESDVDPALLNRDFSGTDGGVLVTVDGRSRQVLSIHLPDLSDEHLSQVPRATNRAMAAAELGQDDATPLDEQVDDALESLEEKMTAIESRLDGVEDSLDALARDLGL